MGRRLSLVIILTEGIKGHLNQSRGVARWISSLGGAKVVELHIPELSCFRKFRDLKLKTRFLRRAGAEACRRWLMAAEGENLIRGFSCQLSENRCRAEDCLIISAGNTPAPYNLALGRMFGVRTAVLMSPSATGTSPFDFAIVPEHDFPGPSENIIVTLGAPNAIFPEELEYLGHELAMEFPPLGNESWGILIGGDDDNYSIDPDWIRTNIGPLLEIASNREVDLYITTSRRTRRESEDALCEIVNGMSNVRMNLIASKDPRNPVPGILGLCDKIFCTEDSVSMVSEAVTSGKDVFLLRVNKKKGLKMAAGKFVQCLVEKRILPVTLLWGPGRFDRMLRKFIEKGFLVEMSSEKGEWCNLLTVVSDTGGNREKFNEARRTAQWILEKMDR